MSYMGSNLLYDIDPDPEIDVPHLRKSKWNVCRAPTSLQLMLIPLRDCAEKKPSQFGTTHTIQKILIITI